MAPKEGGTKETAFVWVVAPYASEPSGRGAVATAMPMLADKTLQTVRPCHLHPSRRGRNSLVLRSTWQWLASRGTDQT